VGSAPGVEQVIRVRGRWTGRVVRLDLDLRLAPDASVRTAIATQAWIEERVRADHEAIGEVEVSLRP